MADGYGPWGASTGGNSGFWGQVTKAFAFLLIFCLIIGVVVFIGRGGMRKASDERKAERMKGNQAAKAKRVEGANRRKNLAADTRACRRRCSSTPKRGGRRQRCIDTCIETLEQGGSNLGTTQPQAAPATEEPSGG